MAYANVPSPTSVQCMDARYTGKVRYQKNIAVLKVTVLYTVGLLNTTVYRPAVLIFNKLSSLYNLFHFVHCGLRYASPYDMRCPNPPRRLHKWGLCVFTIIVIKFTSSANIYGKENRWDEPCRWFAWLDFCTVVYDWWRHEIPRYTGITVFIQTVYSRRAFLNTVRDREFVTSAKKSRILTNFPKLKKFVKIRKKNSLNARV